jgi:hypothetical protein
MFQKKIIIEGTLENIKDNQAIFEYIVNTYGNEAIGVFKDRQEILILLFAEYIKQIGKTVNWYPGDIKAQKLSKRLIEKYRWQSKTRINFAMLKCWFKNELKSVLKVS